jgi:hypothetical protein
MSDDVNIVYDVPGRFIALRCLFACCKRCWTGNGGIVQGIVRMLAGAFASQYPKLIRASGKAYAAFTAVTTAISPVTL